MFVPKVQKFSFFPFLLAIFYFCLRFSHFHFHFRFWIFDFFHFRFRWPPRFCRLSHRNLGTRRRGRHTHPRCGEKAMNFQRKRSSLLFGKAERFLQFCTQHRRSFLRRKKNKKKAKKFCRTIKPEFSPTVTILPPPAKQKTYKKQRKVNKQKERIKERFVLLFFSFGKGGSGWRCVHVSSSSFFFVCKFVYVCAKNSSRVTSDNNRHVGMNGGEIPLNTPFVCCVYAGTCVCVRVFLGPAWSAFLESRASSSGDVSSLTPPISLCTLQASLSSSFSLFLLRYN